MEKAVVSRMTCTQSRRQLRISMIPQHVDEQRVSGRRRTAPTGRERAAAFIRMPRTWRTPLLIGTLLSCLALPGQIGGTQPHASPPRAEATPPAALRAGQMLAGFQVTAHY